MKRALAVVVVVLAAVAQAAPAREARVAHLTAALAQLRAGDPYALERALHEAIRTRCRTAASAATTSCMIGVARELCGSRSCLAAADIIITNQHAERDLVDEPTRMRLVRTSSDYHAAVLVELRARYAILAAELALARPEASLAAQIDRLCVERDRIARRCAPDAAACLASIPYQRCAAALVWFASTAPRGANP